MRIYFLLLLNVFIVSQLMSQLAPDFTVTDADGNIHHLYSDYLDQDKTVVLKLFFVECPPCISIAPLFDDLYKEWGSGEYDVQFISLSTKDWTSNNNSGVASYLLSHELDYIGVGNDGGSLEASNPYTTGTFGSYFGTPTFVVIAPDRTVHYKPTGFGDAGTIAAINQAIIDTGASGNTGNSQTTYNYDISYMSNMSNPADSVFLQNGDGTNQVVLSTNSFVLPDADLYPGIYDPHLYFVKNEKAYVDLNIVDIIKLRKHILKIDKFENPNSLIVGDLNQDEIFDIADIIILNKLVLRIYDGLPNGTAMYRFLSDLCPVSDPNCLGGIPLPSVPGSVSNLSIEVIKMGDISVFE